MNPEKSIKLGVAAHITAASPGGPRFDPTINQEERCHIKNGIWLCVNCSTLIDKDPGNYSATLLSSWKNESEEKVRETLMGSFSRLTSDKPSPYIEADLIWNRAGRSTFGWSEKNFKDGENKILYAGQNYLMHYELKWHFKLLLHNNSPAPAYNINFSQINGYKPDSISKIPKINNLPPFDNFEVDIVFTQNFEGYHYDADKLIMAEIPDFLNGSSYIINYQDEARKTHSTSLSFDQNRLVNKKIIE